MWILVYQIRGERRKGERGKGRTGKGKKGRRRERLEKRERRKEDLNFSKDFRFLWYLCRVSWQILMKL